VIETGEEAVKVSVGRGIAGAGLLGALLALSGWQAAPDRPSGPVDLQVRSIDRPLSGPGVRKGSRSPAFLKGVERIKIPFGPRRKRQMAAYSKRHYGKYEWRLEPRQIVLHYATAPTLGSVFNTFSDPRPDQTFGETPQVCAHFVVAPGKAVQMVSLRARCRHTLGLNHVAIGIEHLGYSDGEVIGNRGMRLRSLSLVRRLRCLYGIGVRDVIGHAESLRSRYYRERVASLQGMTSADFSRETMRTYRQRLSRRGCPRT
jgi:N-acetylmuramoyl-L-alanine amidase